MKVEFKKVREKSYFIVSNIDGQTRNSSPLYQKKNGKILRYSSVRYKNWVEDKEVTPQNLVKFNIINIEIVEDSIDIKPL